MASTYSSLKFELIGTGEQVGTWGSTTNTNIGTAIQEAITGSANITFSGVDITLTLTNTNASQTARNLRLRLIGTSGGARNLTVPNIQKNYIIKNELDDDVTIKNSTGSGVVIQAGTSSYVYSTGAGVEEVISSALFIPSGVITMWSGSIATIPFGWALCDGGTYGAVTTPDLTEKFIVGANTSGTFAQGETGGFADPTLPQHSHGISDPTHTHTMRYQATGNSGTPEAGYGIVAGGAFGGAIAYNFNASTRASDPASTGITVSNYGESDITNKNLPPWFALAYIMKL